MCAACACVDDARGVQVPHWDGAAQATQLARACVRGEEVWRALAEMEERLAGVCVSKEQLATHAQVVLTSLGGKVSEAALHAQ